MRSVVPEKIQQSPKKFKVEVKAKSEVITIDMALTANVNQHICTSGKVMKIDTPVQVMTKTGKTLTKRDCIIRDATATCRIVLWEKDINILQKGNCYKFMKVLIRQYEGVKYLSYCDGARVEVLPDIIEIDEDDDEEFEEQSSPEPILTATGQIVSVLNVTDYSSCIVFTGSVQPINNCLPNVRNAKQQ